VSGVQRKGPTYDVIFELRADKPLDAQSVNLYTRRPTSCTWVVRRRPTIDGRNEKQISNRVYYHHYLLVFILLTPACTQAFPATSFLDYPNNFSDPPTFQH
jgi:hypothetical protein